MCFWCSVHDSPLRNSFIHLIPSPFLGPKGVASERSFGRFLDSPSNNENDRFEDETEFIVEGSEAREIRTCLFFFGGEKEPFEEVFLMSQAILLQWVFIDLFWGKVYGELKFE